MFPPQNPVATGRWTSAAKSMRERERTVPCVLEEEWIAQQAATPSTRYSHYETYCLWKKNWKNLET